MEQLKEHRQFRNQLIIVTIMLFLFGWFLTMPFDFLAADAATEGAGTMFGFGFVFGLIAIFNIFTYRANKKDYLKLNEL